MKTREAVLVTLIIVIGSILFAGWAASGTAARLEHRPPVVARP